MRPPCLRKCHARTNGYGCGYCHESFFHKSLSLLKKLIYNVISFSTCHEVLPIEGIPKNAFSTSCPEVEELYLIIYKPVSNSFIQEFKTLSLW